MIDNYVRAKLYLYDNLCDADGRVMDVFQDCIYSGTINVRKFRDLRDKLTKFLNMPGVMLIDNYDPA